MTLTFSDILNAISTFIALWKSPIAKGLVFLFFTILFYLQISTIVYTQISMWMKDKTSTFPRTICLVISIPISMFLSSYVVIGIQSIIDWWQGPQNTATIPYNPFWFFLFIVPVVLLGLWVAISIHRIANKL